MRTKIIIPMSINHRHQNPNEPSHTTKVKKIIKKIRLTAKIRKNNRLKS